MLFTGSPCQVAGLYSFLGKKYETLFTCDFVCHGVPSQKAFDKYLEKINLSYFENSIFQFRDTKRWGFQLAINGCNIRLKDTYYLKAFTRGYMFMENATLVDMPHRSGLVILQWLTFGGLEIHLITLSVMVFLYCDKLQKKGKNL